MFSGAALWFILSTRFNREKDAEDTESRDEPTTNTQTVQPSTASSNLLAKQAAATDPEPKLIHLPVEIQSVSVDLSEDHSTVKMIKCNCGLELSEDAMLEHAEGTGHSKPFDAAVKVGKIWDLQEAVIESASPACSKCGKPVQGLKRIGKTIYVSHAGCADAKSEVDDTDKPTVKKTKTRTCSICWRSISEDAAVTQVESLSGQKLMFHEECLGLRSRSQLLVGEEPSQRYRRTIKW